jgi:hypothetical protein
MATMSWSISVQVAGGETLTAATAAIPVEATDRIFVTVNPGDKDKVVEIQPGTASAIQLLVVKSSRYGQDLSFKVSDGKKDSSALAVVVMDAPQVFTGGSVALFGLAPQLILLTISASASGEPADVEIFVARDATP